MLTKGEKIQACPFTIRKGASSELLLVENKVPFFSVNMNSFCRVTVKAYWLKIIYTTGKMANKSTWSLGLHVGNAVNYKEQTLQYLFQKVSRAPAYVLRVFGYSNINLSF